jgi:hypothetical protein
LKHHYNIHETRWKYEKAFFSDSQKTKNFTLSREREREIETYRGYPKAKRRLQVKHKQKAENT